MTLVRQRLENDCTLCCIAMATGRSWAEVFEAALWVPLGYRPWNGTQSVEAVCAVLGVAVQFYHEPFGLSQDGRRQWIWGRRAILSVPTLNDFDGHHDVYWDGAHVLDPSNGKTYADDLGAVPINDMAVFDESGQLAPSHFLRNRSRWPPLTPG